ncbi:MAG: hypothetical protein PWQ06_846 [Anaerophaga sp.]|nr:hypothetical protein [Anaerophaga sp.]
MNKLSIKKKNLLLVWIPFLIITGSIFFDLLNGFIQIVLNKNFSIGVIYRGIFLLALFPYALKKQTILTNSFIFIVFFFVIANYIWLLSQSFYDPVFEIKMISRSVYLYVISSFFIYYRNTIETKKLLKFVLLFGVIGGTAIIFSYITGIGLDTYGDYAFGIKSFFPAQNDTSLALLLALLIAIYIFIKQRKFIYFIYAIVITTGCFLLGTRAGIAGSILVWITVFGGLFFFKFKDINISRLSKGIVFIIFILVLSVGIWIGLQIVVDNQYLLNKFTIDALVGGQARGRLAEAGEKIILESDFIDLFFGHGKFAHSITINYLVEGNFNELSQAEIDYLDYIGSYGIILGGIFLLIPFLFLLRSALTFFKNKTLFNFILMLGFIFYAGHSFYAGHAINSPIVSTVFSVYIFFVYMLYQECSEKAY